MATRTTPNYCPHCEQSYGANSGHCTGGPMGGCCRSWATQAGHDAHRVGSYDDGTRRCMTDQEMLDAGWRCDPDGRWASPKDIKDRERSAAKGAWK